MGLKAALVPQVDYAGGLNAATNPLAVQENELTDCVNVHTNIFKSIERRAGYAKLNATVVSSDDGNAMFDFAITDTNRKLTAIWDDTLRKMDSLDGVWDPVTMTVTIGSGRAELMRYLATEIIFSHASGNVQSWNGTDAATATIPGAAAFKYGWPDENTGRLFAAGLASNEGIAYFSPVNTLSFDTTDDKIQITNISEVLGFRDLKGKMYAMTPEGWYVINALGGLPRFGVKFRSGPGTRSPLSAQRASILGLGEGIIYLDTAKRLQFFNGFDTVPLSIRFEKRTSVSAANTLEQINSAELGEVHAIVWPERAWYVLFYPAGTDSQHNNVMVYDLNMKSAWPFTNIPANSATVAIDGNKTQRFYFSDFEGQTYRFDNNDNNDDGTSIPSHAELNRKAPTKGFTHKFRQVNATVKVTGAFTLSVKARTDFTAGYTKLHDIDLSGGGDTLGDTFILGASTLGSVEAVIVPIGIDLIGRYLQLRFEDNSDSPSWQVFGDDLAARQLEIN